MLNVLDRLAFGRAIPTGGGSVSDADWSAFEASEVASRFPEGYTVSIAQGAWRDVATGLTVHEDTILLDVAHEGKPEDHHAVLAIASAYKRRFQQDAVARFTTPARVSFI